MWIYIFANEAEEAHLPRRALVFSHLSHGQIIGRRIGTGQERPETPESLWKYKNSETSVP
jgi:hypothetical protein